MITYTATRSLSLGHVVNTIYTLEFETTQADQETTVDKSMQQSKSGSLETIYNRIDKRWTIQFQPLYGRDLDRLEEFLDSTNAGELFYIYPYGPESTPLRLRRTDSGYKFVLFQALGRAELDYFQATAITAIEA